MSPAAAPDGRGAGRAEFLGAPFDLAGLEDVLAALRARTPSDRFGYVVTPNVDHVVRLAREPGLLACYRDAWMSWCDSRPLRRLARLRGLHLPLLTGSDMTALLFARVLRPGDRVACVLADEALLEELRAVFPQYDFTGHCPPHGFEADAAAFARCVDFIAGSGARFVLIGVGSPRSERLAHAVRRSGRASGTALCIGASLEFLTGRKRRAPLALRRLGLEWLHRVSSEPRRLWRRYASAVVPLSLLFARDLLRR